MIILNEGHCISCANVPLMDDRLTLWTLTGFTPNVRDRRLCSYSPMLPLVARVRRDGRVIFRGSFITLTRPDLADDTDRRFGNSSRLISSFTQGVGWAGVTTLVCIFCCTGGRIPLLPASVGLSLSFTRTILTLAEDGADIEAAVGELLSVSVNRLKSLETSLRVNEIFTYCMKLIDHCLRYQQYEALCSHD